MISGAYSLTQHFEELIGAMRAHGTIVLCACIIKVHALHYQGAPWRYLRMYWYITLSSKRPYRNIALQEYRTLIVIKFHTTRSSGFLSQRTYRRRVRTTPK